MTRLGVIGIGCCVPDELLSVGRRRVLNGPAGHTHP